MNLADHTVLVGCCRGLLETAYYLSGLDEGSVIAAVQDDLRAIANECLRGPLGMFSAALERARQIVEVERVRIQS